MGYSHYFETGTLVLDEPFLADVRAIVRVTEAMGIALTGDPCPVDVGRLPHNVVVDFHQIEAFMREKGHEGLA